MAMNETSAHAEKSMNGLMRFWMLLIDPHPSVEEIGERARAQLLAILTLILSLVYGWALISRPTSYNEFLALLFFTFIAYALSRTPYYRLGIYFLCFSFIAFAYITLYLGTASSYASAITTSVHVSLVVASLLLSPLGLAALVTFVSVASFSAPLYSAVPIALDSDYYKDTGV